MRLLTQNLLVCNVRACVETATRGGGSIGSGGGGGGGVISGAASLSFPLRVEVSAGGLEQRPSDFSAARVLALLPKLDWPALRATAAQMGIAELPPAPPAAPAEDEAFLRSVHTLVLDVHVTEGSLLCPHCARVYPIHKGIPNMLLSEAEL